MSVIAAARHRPATLRHKSAAQQVLIGHGVIAELGAILDELGSGRIGVLASQRTWAAPIGRRTAAALADTKDLLVSHQVRPHTPRMDVHSLAADFLAEGVDRIVAIGGGSASDLAKSVAAAMSPDANRSGHPDLVPLLARPRHRLGVGSAFAGPLPALVAVPTTLSGAEFTYGAASTDAGVKRVLNDPALGVRAIVQETSLDNDLTRDIVAATGMNAIAHCVEGTYSIAGTSASDATAYAGLALLVEGMVRRLAHDEDSDLAREQLFTGAALAGMTLLNAATCLHHALCHVLGARYGVGHGEANAVVLSHVVELNYPHAPGQLERCAEVIRTSARRVAEPLTGTTPAEVIRSFERRIGAPTSLAEIGIDEIEEDDVIQLLSHEPGLARNPFDVRPEDVRLLLASARRPV